MFGVRCRSNRSDGSVKELIGSYCRGQERTGIGCFRGFELVEEENVADDALLIRRRLTRSVGPGRGCGSHGA